MVENDSHEPTIGRIGHRATACRPIPPAALTLLIGAAFALTAGPVRADTPVAEYTVAFEATWSEETHPGTLPPNPHFSGLIGGLHNDQVSFWTLGELATRGIENMAEFGSKSRLENEVGDAIAAGSAEAVLSGGGIGNPPDVVEISFTAHEDFPLMTLVSMVAPSPDWFVGVDSLGLMNGNRWRNRIVVPLHVYDAGTDSGTTFTSPDQDTDPADPITLFDSGPFAPPMQYVGTFTITRTDAAPLPLLADGAPRTILCVALGGIGIWLAGAGRADACTRVRATRRIS